MFFAYNPLQSVQLDIMIYDRFEYHNYKYVIGIIDVYSRYVACRPITNMRMETLMEKIKEMFDNDFVNYPENINCDNQFDVPEFTNFFTHPLRGKGTNLYFSQPDQPHKNAVIERFWRTLAILLQRMREGIKNFDWVKALPDVIHNYNNTYHRILKAKPIEVLQGQKENPVERVVVESLLRKGMKVRIKEHKTLFSKGDVRTFSRDIYQIIEKKGQKNTLRNLTTGQEVRRTYTDEELDQTFNQPEVKPKKEKKIKKPEQELLLRDVHQVPKRSAKKPQQPDFVYY